jgi:bifunctional non-homologous end joining protein LigD
MLARLTHSIPQTADYSWEIKWDGYRAGLVYDGRQLLNRSRKSTDITPWFPELRDLHQQIDFRSGLIDGEIVAGNGDVESFNDLLRRTRSRGREASHVSATFIAFDVLYCNGQDMRTEPIEARRKLLNSIVSPANGIAISRVYDDGRTFYTNGVRAGLEGVVGKRVGSIYVAGRSPAWIKPKPPMRRSVTNGARDIRGIAHTTAFGSRSR